LRDQIAEFRSQFFQLDVESRKARFEKLHTDAEYFPVLKLQLSKLKSGLELTKEPVNELGEGASQLLRFLMNNHVEEPSQKPARRREFQALNTHRTSDWKRFVTELKQHAPAVAALDSRWLQQLSHPAKSRNKLVKIGSNGDSAEKSSSRSNWAVVLVVIFIVRLLITISRHSNEDYSSTSSYNPPSMNSYTPPDFSAEKLQEILDSIGDPGDAMDSPERAITTDETGAPDINADLSEVITAQLINLQEYEFLRLESHIFKIVKEGGEYFIVFDESRYLAEISIVTKLSVPHGSRLYKSRKFDLEQFEMVTQLIRELQGTVYVTYPGANGQRAHSVPEGVVFKPMRGDFPIMLPAMTTEGVNSDDWKQAYRYQVSPSGGPDDE